jgi:outer membrane protein assembly factor BamB
LFLGTSEGIFVRQAIDGAPLWQELLAGRLLSRPAISGETLLLASIESDVLLSAFIAESGTVRWSFSPAAGE